MRTDIIEIQDAFEAYQAHDPPMVRQMCLAEIMGTMSFHNFYQECIRRGLHEDLMEVGSNFMTKDQLLNCHCVIKDKMDYELKRLRRQNIELYQKINKMENYGITRAIR